MDTENLRLLVDVAKHGSFAAAARSRGLDPSSVSRQIAQTEQELGLRLFQRTTRRLSPTHAGDVLLTRIESILDELDKTIESATSQSVEPTGCLRVTTSVAFGQICLVPLLGSFRKRFPMLAIELLLDDGNIDFVSDRVDLAIRLGPAIRGDLICSKLRDTRYRVVASPAYLDYAGAPSRPRDLSQRDVLLFNLPPFRSRWLFRNKSGRVSDVPVQGQIVISSANALRDATLAGLGPALLADWLIDRDIENGRLVDLFPQYQATATTFQTAAWIVYPSRNFLPARVRMAIDFLREHLNR